MDSVSSRLETTYVNISLKLVGVPLISTLVGAAVTDGAEDNDARPSAPPAVAV